MHAKCELIRTYRSDVAFVMPKTKKVFVGYLIIALGINIIIIYGTHESLSAPEKQTYLTNTNAGNHISAELEPNGETEKIDVDSLLSVRGTTHTSQPDGDQVWSRVHEVVDAGFIQATERTPSESIQQTEKISEATPANIFLGTASPGPLTSRATLPLENERIISGSTPGRLGNQMFKHASLLGLALKSNRTLVHESVHFGNGFAHLTSLPFSAITPNHQKAENFKRIHKFGSGICWPSVTQFLTDNQNTPHVIVQGYMQAWCYFNEYRKRVTEEFQFQEELVSFRNDYLTLQARQVFGDRISPSDVTYIGVHIRRGDMLNDAAIGRVVADEAYLDRAVDYMENHTQSSTYKIYIVGSSDRTWSKEHFRTKSPYTFLTGRVPGYSPAFVDMAVLAGCNHSIITVGTFGWWAAYLAGGTTVYYRKFPLEGTELGNKLNKDDYYLPEWIGFE